MFWTMSTYGQSHSHRRAKAKLQETRKEQGEGEQGAELAPALVAGSDAELSYLVHEDERKVSLYPPSRTL